MSKRYEYELYEPIANYFRYQGYLVYGEVVDCDLIAKQDEHIIIVELKLNLNITVIYQAIERLKISDEVYIAVQKPSRMSRKNYYKMRRLCQMLGIGLFLIDTDDNLTVVCMPVNVHSIKKTKKKKFLEELNKQKFNVNIGGVTNEKINTSYRERCLEIAYILEGEGKISAKILKDKYQIDKAYPILYNNYYGWFEKIERGSYRLTNLAIEQINEDRYREQKSFYTSRRNNE